MKKNNSRKSAQAKRSTAPARPTFSTILYCIAALIAVGGLADAIYLTVNHLTGENLTCGVGCSEVLRSKYAVVLGLPVSLFGAFGYFTAFSCVIFALFHYRYARQLLSITVATMFLSTLWFLYVQAAILHDYCRYCLLSGALTFALSGLVVALPPEAAKAS